MEVRTFTKNTVSARITKHVVYELVRLGSQYEKYTFSPSKYGLRGMKKISELIQTPRKWAFRNEIWLQKKNEQKIFKNKKVRENCEIFEKSNNFFKGFWQIIGFW